MVKIKDLQKVKGYRKRLRERFLQYMLIFTAMNLRKFLRLNNYDRRN